MEKRDHIKSRHRGSLRTAIVGLLCASGTAHLVQFVSAPLLIALYDPASFGTFAMALAVASTLGSISAFRYERAIVMAESVDTARQVLKTCLLLNVVVCLIVSLGVSAAYLYLSSEHFGGGHLVLLTGTLTLLIGAQETFSHWLIRHEKFQRIGGAEIRLSLITVMTQLACGYLYGAKAELLLVGVLLGRIVALGHIVNGCEDWREYDSDLRSRMLSILSTYKSLAIYAVPYAIVTTLQFRSLLFLAAYFGSTAEAGCLAFAHRLTYVPATTIGMALRRVFFAKFSVGRADPKTMEHALGVLTRLALVVPLLVVMAGLLLPPLTTWIPSDWHSTVYYVLALLPFAGVLVFTSWFDRVYDVFNRQKSALAFETVATVVSLAAFCLTAGLGRSTVAAMVAYSGSLVVYNLFWMAYTWKLLEWSPASYWRIAGGVIAYTALLSVSFLVGCFSLPLATTFLLSIGAVVWTNFDSLTQWVNNKYGYG